MRFPYQLADGSGPYKVRWGLCKDVWPHHEVSFLFWMVTVNNIQSLDITNTLPPTCKSINIELVLVLVLMFDIYVFQGERCQHIKCKALPVIENNLREGKQSVWTNTIKDNMLKVGRVKVMLVCQKNDAFVNGSHNWQSSLIGQITTQLLLCTAFVGTHFIFSINIWPYKIHESNNIFQCHGCLKYFLKELVS